MTEVPPARPIDLRACGIDEMHAACLRARLRTIAEGWDRPDMDAYDVVYALPPHPGPRPPAPGPQAER